MSCLLSEIKFYTTIDDILIQHSDLGTFKYTIKLNIIPASLHYY